MNRPQHTNAASTPWYVFVGDGICLKVPSELSVGEDRSGMVVLNPKQADQNLLHMDLDESGRLLLEAVGQAHVLEWEVGSASVVNGLVSLQPGTRVVLPHNELYFGHEMQPGSDSARLVLEEMIAIVPEPLPEAVPARDPEPVRQPKPQSITTPTPPKADSPPLLVKEARVKSRATTRARRGIRRRTGVSNPANWLMVLAIALLALGPYLYYEVYRSDAAQTRPAAGTPPAPEARQEQEAPIINPPAVDTPAVDTPARDTPTRDTPAAAPELRQSTPVSVDVEVPNDVLQAIEVIEAIEPAQPAAEIPADARVVAEPLVDPLTMRRLERAKNYLDRGSIISPADDNVVGQLSLVLISDPDNAEALALMGQAADQLVAEAVDTYEQGSRFEARNLIEEVLAFHPQHAAAREYWRRWTDE